MYHFDRKSLIEWWPGTESNSRHGGFQSPALPTELPGRFVFLRRCCEYSVEFRDFLRRILMPLYQKNDDLRIKKQYGLLVKSIC